MLSPLRLLSLLSLLPLLSLAACVVSSGKGEDTALAPETCTVRSVTLSDQTTTSTIDVPEGTTSWMLVVTPQSGDTSYPQRLTAPDGRAYLDAEDTSTPIQSSGSASAGRPWAAVVPASDDWPVDAGAWQLSQLSGAPVQIDAYFKSDCTGEAASLPMVFWFPTLHYPASAPLSAATAPDDPTLQNAIATARALYEDIGIEITPIRYRDLSEVVSSAQSADAAIIDSFAEGDDLIGAGLGADDTPGVHVVLVDSFDLPEGYIVGYAADTPGAIAGRGLHSAVFLRIDDLYEAEGTGESLGLTIAHESGHSLGLHHTTESTGTDASSFDRLTDTPMCTATDSDGLHSLEVCTDAGGDNVMFWAPQAFTSFSDDIPYSHVFTDQQAAVLHANLNVR